MIRILVVADGRSPHTVGWLRGMKKLGLDPVLLSSHRLSDQDFEAVSESVRDDKVFQSSGLWNRVRPTVGTIARIAQSRRKRKPGFPVTPSNSKHTEWIVKLDLASGERMASQIAKVAKRCGINAVHALRVQFEGIAAVASATGLPVAVSTWGQDLVRTPNEFPAVQVHTRRAIQGASVLFSDCHRDAKIAVDWGLPSTTPRHVIPGNFGVNFSDFAGQGSVHRWGLSDEPLVLYPRAVRRFVNYHGFVEAARSLVGEGVNASFLGVGLSGAIPASANIPGRFVCTDVVARSELLKLMVRAAVIVSPSLSDGMPNSVLEGMAAGAIPVCGKIDSLAELESAGAMVAWCDPSNAKSITEAIQQALAMSTNTTLVERNRAVVRTHYSVEASMEKAARAYSDLEKVIP